MSEILTIKIKPGWKKGTKITFPEKGNKQHGDNIPSDIVFIIDEKPHSIFKRNGDNLIATQKISLAEASTGYTAQLTTLDGRSLTIPFSCGISPTNEEVVKGEGMPSSKEPTRKGNLHIKFDINSLLFVGYLNLNKLSVDKNLIEVFAKGFDKEHVLLCVARASRTENQDAIDAAIVGTLADPKEARAGIREVHFLPFNPVDKRTALTYIDSDGNWHRTSKGAPEQVCGLKWSHDDRELASGGNDNQVFVANIGDAKAVVARSSITNGSENESNELNPFKAIVLTREHKAIYPQERAHIQKLKDIYNWFVRFKYVNVVLSGSGEAGKSEGTAT